MTTFKDLFESEPSLVPAIKHDGKVYRGKHGEDHIDVLKTLPDHVKKAVGWNNDYRGFVTHKGHFVGRERAQKYAVEHGLLSDKLPDWAKKSKTLPADFLKGHRSQE